MGENAGETTAESPPLLSSLSNQATTELLDLLLARGYFHDSADPMEADPLRGNPSTTIENAETLQQFSQDDAACQIVRLTSKADNDASCCCTFPVLESKLRHAMEASGGRSSMKHLVTALNLNDETPLVRILEEQRVQQPTKQDLFQLGDEIYSSLYLDRTSQIIFETLLVDEEKSPREKAKGVKTAGFALVSDLASLDFHLPLDVAITALKDRTPNESLKILHLEAGPTIVSQSYMKQHEQDVIKVFSVLKEPSTIYDVCHAHHWDVGLVANWVTGACHDGKLPGEMHGGSDASVSSGRAMYAPHVHVQAQRQAVDDLFAAQGYMTEAKGVALGLSLSKMGEYIQKSFPSALVVSDSLVVNPETILRPLEAVLEEAITMNGFVDIQDHVPTDILVQEQDTRDLLNKHVMSALMEQTGSKTKSSKKKKSSSSLGIVVLSSSSGGGLFVSEGMISNVEKKLFPDLIVKHAKKRAEEIDAAEVAGDGGRATASASKSKATSSKTKGGRKGKKGSKSADQDDTEKEGLEEVIVPLIEVVQSIVSEYQEIVEADLVLKEALERAEKDGSALQLQWERTAGTGQKDSEFGGSGDGSCNVGLICQFCWEAFYSEDLISKCQRAVQAELKRLQSARMSKASVSRKDAATKVRNVESAFEEAYIAFCYQIQAQAKFLDYVDGCEGDTNALGEKLTAEFLRGSCVDFTRNLTQYCLFKHELDLDTFHFLVDDVESNSGDGDESNGDGTVPLYCKHPNIGARRPPQTFLRLNESHASDNEASKAKEPLTKLREILPGSVGVALARQWVMCGGSCYQGGTKKDEGGNEFARPGDLEKLMAHLEENCLSLCGFPFKKFDKKSEKHFLFARRQGLLKLVESNADASAILDLTIIILFQQVKSVVAFGSSLHPDLLNLLTSERKIGEEVAGALTKLAEAIEGGDQSIDPAWIEAVRGCGLCRDIAKHQVAAP